MHKILFFAAALAFSFGVAGMTTPTPAFAAKAKAVKAPQSKPKFNWNICMARKTGNGVNPRDAARGCSQLQQERS